MHYGIFFNPNAVDGNAEKLAERMCENWNKPDIPQIT